MYFWSKSLVSFSLWSNFPSSKLRYSLKELCNTPHSLPALRHLTLDIGTFLLKSLTLPILFQLRSFRLASADMLESILPTLMEYYQHSSSKKPKCIIDLPTVTDVETCLESDKDDLLTVASLFTRLSFNALIWHFYRLFASNFTSLAIVKVDAYRCDSPNQLFSSLATLQKLTHLTLLLTTKIECTTITSNLPSIHSVRWLMIKCSIGDTQLAKYPLKHLFPAVEHIKVRFSDRNASVIRAFALPLGMPRLSSIKHRQINGKYRQLSRTDFENMIQRQQQQIKTKESCCFITKMIKL